MKTTVEMSIQEFLNFKEFATKHKITFICVITHACTYLVTTDLKIFQQLGFI